MENKILNRIIGILLIINTSIFIISFSIAFVILFRPFYYVQIKCLNIEEESGYSYSEIKEAYDDILDYTTLNKSFKTGTLAYSQDGYDHFKDCKLLFMIDFILLGISTIIIILKKKFFNNIKLLNHKIGFLSGIIVITLFILLSIISFIVGFDTCFEVFHKIFFLGKDNWIFDSRTDEIIKILPEQYFMNCAILSIVIIMSISIFLIIKDRNKKGEL